MPFKKLCCCPFHSEQGHRDASIKELFQTKRRGEVLWYRLIQQFRTQRTKMKDLHFLPGQNSASKKIDAKHLRYAVLISQKFAPIVVPDLTVLIFLWFVENQYFHKSKEAHVFFYRLRQKITRTLTLSGSRPKYNKTKIQTLWHL